MSKSEIFFAEARVRQSSEQFEKAMENFADLVEVKSQQMHQLVDRVKAPKRIALETRDRFLRQGDLLARQLRHHGGLIATRVQTNPAPYAISAGVLLSTFLAGYWLGSDRARSFSA